MALTLLELVNSAGQREDGEAVESVWSSRLEPSVAQTSDFAFRKAETRTVKNGEVDYLEDLIVRKDGGWEITSPNALEEDKLVNKLMKKLKHKLDTFSTSEFIALVRPALLRVTGLESQSHGRDENGAVDGEDPNKKEEPDEEGSFLGLLRKGGALVGRRLLVATINCSLGLQFWKALKVLMHCGLVSSVSHPHLVPTLVEHRKADLLCTCFHYVLDLTPSDILVALKFLLKNSNASSCESVRQEWRRVASAAIDVAVRRKEAFVRREEYLERELLERQRVKMERRRAKAELAFENDPFNAPVVHEEGSVLLPARIQIQERERRMQDEAAINSSEQVIRAVVMAMAVDGFQGWETCLHALLASAQDEAVLAAILAELDTSEAVQLLQYLRKWIDRYSHRLSRIPSPPGKPGKPLHNVPSSQQVLQWVNMVLDGQYTNCVLSSEFLPVLYAIQKSVGSAVAIGRRVAPLIGTIEHLRDKHPLPARRQDSAAHSDYTIEYLDIS